MGLLGTKWLLRAIKTIPHDERKRDYDSEQSHFFDRSACQRSSLADLYSRYGAPSSAPRQVFPSSVEKTTSVIP